MNEDYSVLMSVYYKNSPSELRQSINSMLNQTVLCKQFIIVKDGPLSKELDDVIVDYTQKHPNLFTILPLTKNHGLGYALDYGIKQSRYELVARMDSDDISLPKRCEKELQVFSKNKSISIVGTNINEFFNDPDNVSLSRVVPEKGDEIKRFSRRRSPFNHPTVMYKKSAVLKCGGYGSSSRKEDLYLFTNMINSGYEGYNIQEALLLYRANDNNYKRRKTWVNCKEYIDVIYLNMKKGYCS